MPCVVPTSFLGDTNMIASITVFVIAFGVGCPTGVVVRLLSHDRRANDSGSEPVFGAMTADD